jgi:hypothetical protein
MAVDYGCPAARRPGGRAARLRVGTRGALHRSGGGLFLIQIFSNAASALAWAVSIVLRWPLLGVVVGTVLGQKTRWRRDPALLRAYSRASWIWVGQYLTRLAVFIPLWAAGMVTALGVARVSLTWPLIAACLAVSWWVLRRSLPEGHPGLRHPASGEWQPAVDHGETGT